MYLLKLNDRQTLDSGEKFTFHHVSIKTHLTQSTIDISNQHSHSTMYLLKPKRQYAWFCGFEFTFHHVSIKTKIANMFGSIVSLFTFHHVSIKTGIVRAIIKAYNNSHSTMYLLKHIRHIK